MVDFIGSAFSAASGLLGGGDVGSDAASAANASNALAIAELRRQFGITQENIAPFIEAGTGALPGVIEGTTAEGLDARLARIFDTDIFGSLVEERGRAVQGGLAAGGLTRSGEGLRQIANVPTDIGLALEALLTGRSTNLATSGQNAALGLGGIGANTSQNIATLLTQQGQNTASGIIGDAQAGAAQQQQLLGAAATAASIFFSDPALKENVEKISEIGDLDLVQWDWIDDAKGTMIEKCGTVGFMADDVRDIHPDCVSEFGGFLVIDYPNLLDRLEMKCRH